MRETEKLPQDAAKFYQKSIRHGYEQHSEEVRATAGRTNKEKQQRNYSSSVYSLATAQR